MGDHNGQRDLLACVQPEDANLYRRPPERQRALNVCVHQGGRGGGGTPSSVRFLSAARGGEGDTPTTQRAPPSAHTGVGGRGGTPT